MTTSIAPGAYSADAYRARLNAERFVDLKSQMEDLQRQLSTGKISDDWAGLGPSRVTALDLGSVLSSYDGFASNIQDAQTRLKIMDQSLTQLDKGRSEAIGTLSLDSYQLRSGGTTQGQILLTGRFNEMIDLLNTDVAGRYAFSGRATNVKPVVSSDAILNGANGKIGLIQAITNQRAADGVTTSGGLTTAVAGNVVTATTGAGGFTVSGSGSFDFTTLPTDGQVYKLTLALSDGSTETVSLAATATGTVTNGLNFAIGANSAATAANFKTSLDQALTTLGNTALYAASAVKASSAFFAGTVPNAVQWYVGDSAPDPRATALVRASDGDPISTGAQANEVPFQQLLSNYAVMAAETFPASNPYSAQRFDAIKSRLMAGLAEPSGQKIKDVQMQLALSSVDIARAADRNATRKAVIQDHLGAIEDATPEQVATALLSLQTQLQASYQTTSMVSKMSLVNYL